MPGVALTSYATPGIVTVMRFYHATTAPLGEIREGLCVTDNPDAADTYLDGQTGRRYEINLPALHLLERADEDDLAEAAQACGMTEDDWMDWGGIFYAADQDNVRAHLAAEGFHLVEYTDQEQTSSDAHRTLRILDPSIVTAGAYQPVND